MKKYSLNDVRKFFEDKQKNCWSNTNFYRKYYEGLLGTTIWNHQLNGLNIDEKLLVSRIL